MWTTLAFTLSLAAAPAQADELKVTHVRNTHGILGQARKGTGFLPGDHFVLSFDIEGLKVDDNGKVLYSIGLEVLDSDGKVKFRQAPRDLEAVNALGGTQVPAFAQLKIGPDQPPGKYKLKVTVNDVAAKASTSFTQPVEVLKLKFGLVRLSTTTDPDALSPAVLHAVGQTLWINYAVVGFEREGGQPHLTTTLRVLDEDGKPTLAKPLSGEVKADVPKDAKVIPMQFALQLNRPGKFTAEIAVKDVISGKSAKVTFPVTVARIE
jgi:hypothetical protein